MPATQEEQCRAHRAARRYVDLCDAYVAASAAHILVLDRIRAGVQRRGERLSAEERHTALAWVQSRRSNAERTDLAFLTRRSQALARLRELQGV